MQAERLLDPMADLLWLLQAPDLFAPDSALLRVGRPWRQRMAEHDQWLRDPATPDLLHAACRPQRRKRLGWYAEDLWLAWLRQWSRGTLIAQETITEKLPAGGTTSRAQRTLGEADAIWNDDGTWRWWELSVKFYCWSGEGDGSDPDTWFGPNGRERMSEKWQRIRNHQLPLAHQPLTRTYLQEKYAIKATSAAAWVCGHVFIPSGTSPRLPTIIDAHQQPGLWLRHQHLSRLLPTRRSTRFIPLQKLQWLAPRHFPGDISGLWSYQTLQRMPPVERPIIVAEMIPDDSGWRELRRWMILPNSWPG